MAMRDLRAVCGVNLVRCDRLRSVPVQILSELFSYIHNFIFVMASKIYGLI